MNGSRADLLIRDRRGIMSLHYMRIQLEICLESRKRALTRNQIDHGLSISQYWKNKCFLFQPPSLIVIVAQANTNVLSINEERWTRLNHKGLFVLDCLNHESFFYSLLKKFLVQEFTPSLFDTITWGKIWPSHIFCAQEIRIFLRM